MASKTIQRPRREDFTGQVFGQLTVERPSTEGTSKHPKWVCRCECGAIRHVEHGNLKSGRQRSCGRCGARAGSHNGNFTHGLTKTPEYDVWYGMKQRCYWKPHASYSLYGGRGIVVCDRWRESFEHFLTDMGRRPSPTHSIDRIDSDGPYSPENCRWATSDVQAANRRNNHRLTFRGETRTVTQWCGLLGIPTTAVFQRLADGWTIERTLTEPVRRRHLSPNVSR